MGMGRTETFAVELYVLLFYVLLPVARSRS